MAGYGGDDDHRGAELWRIGGDDAPRRRPICVSARVAWTSVGISLWLDAISGDPDRHDCGSGGWFRQIPWHVFPFYLFHNLAVAHRYRPDVEGWPDGAGEYGDRGEQR